MWLKDWKYVRKCRPVFRVAVRMAFPDAFMCLHFHVWLWMVVFSLVLFHIWFWMVATSLWWCPYGFARPRAVWRGCFFMGRCRVVYWPIWFCHGLLPFGVLFHMLSHGSVPGDVFLHMFLPGSRDACAAMCFSWFCHGFSWPQHACYALPFDFPCSSELLPWFCDVSRAMPRA